MVGGTFFGFWSGEVLRGLGSYIMAMRWFNGASIYPSAPMVG